MVIYVKDAKGGKDRIVNLDPIFLQLVREYYRQYKPKVYLFNGQNSDKYSARSIAEFLQNYANKAKINKRVHPHLLRHTSFTHLLEGGLDMTIIQKLAGHNDIRTTQLYGHISHNFISNIKSPLLGIPQVAIKKINKLSYINK
jgi:site-specific recombinase XerD